MKPSLMVAVFFAGLVRATSVDENSVEVVTTVEVITASVLGCEIAKLKAGGGQVSGSVTTVPVESVTGSQLVVCASTIATGVAPVTSTGGALDSYSQSILNQHNNHRANSSAQALSWSDDMASIAAQIAASCVYAHNSAIGGGGYGQNIGAGAEPSEVPGLITNEMYNNEIDWYPPPYGNDNPDMTNFEMWGHYSQIVWKSTTSVGCATQYCPDGLANTDSGVSPYFTVCNYSPPGNIAGQYSNVGEPNGGVANVVVS